jgi:hypothetical protein
MNELATLVIPERGTPVTAVQLIEIESQLAKYIADIDDLDILEEWRAKARALETYLRDKELQGPCLVLSDASRGALDSCWARIQDMGRGAEKRIRMRRV